MENSEPQKLVGLASQEAQVAAAAALVDGWAGGTRPPRLVRCLSDPVTPRREEGPGRRGGGVQIHEPPSHRFSNISRAADWPCNVTTASLSFFTSKTKRRHSSRTGMSISKHLAWQISSSPRSVIFLIPSTQPPHPSHLPKEIPPSPLQQADLSSDPGSASW